MLLSFLTVVTKHAEILCGDIISKFSFIHRPQKSTMYRELAVGNWTQEWI